MCCFSGVVDLVANTKIFARLSGASSQFLAYEMTYKAKQPTAMILPIPTEIPARETTVRFIALDGYREFFKDLASYFPVVGGFSIGCGSSSKEAVAPADYLQVHEVGDFVASFVPTLDDFDRLDPQFVIPRSTWEKVPQYADFGFAVFQLKSLEGKPHPMAFEFKSRWNDRVFFPTVHIHDGEVHKEEQFDHELYLQHAGLDSSVGSYVGPFWYDRVTRLVRSKTSIRGFHADKAQGILSPNLLIHRMDLRGALPNNDQLLPVRGDPLKPSMNLRPLWSLLWGLTPWAVALFAASWFIRRRMRLRGGGESARFSGHTAEEI